MASGIAIQRFGANALDVIENVKAEIARVSASLPAGTEIKTVYDRSELIHRAIETLRTTLIEESLIVAFVCIVFLMHVRSAFVAIISLPIGILIAYVCIHALGLSSNIMSLGGIAIAIGAMVDAAIVMIENAHKRLERAPPGKPRTEVLIEAASEVGPALFFSLLIITVSFLPIFALEAQEGRLFHPLAFTKTFAMAAAALLSVTLVPALMIVFIRGRILPEARNPVNRLLIWSYRPIIKAVLRFRWLTIALAVVILAASVWPARQLGSEFMPNLNEGTLFYMPTTLPGLSVTKAAELLQTQNKIIKSFPEVASVWGKAGRAATATDPAPTEMFETIINLKPESEWRSGVTVDSLIHEMDQALQFPGVSNAWTMPIKARIDMLSTGIRTPVGVKVLGTDLREMEDVARQIEAVLRTVPGTASAFAERIIGGYYMEIVPDRMALARYGLMMGEVQDVIASALGAEPITTTVEGRERYTVAMRYPRDTRSDPDAIRREVLVPLANGASVPLGEVAEVKLVRGPASIRTENAQLAAYIFVDVRDRDLVGYVKDAQRAVADSVTLPTGTYLLWSGQFEYYERAKARLLLVVPLTVAHHRPAALRQFRPADGNADRHAVAAVLAGRRSLADVVARLQPVGRRGRRVHRARRRRRRDGGHHAHLSRPCARGAPPTGGSREASVRSRRSQRCHHGRRRRACETQDDDRRCHHGRSAADPVEPRDRLGVDAAHRRADDRRHGLLDRADAGRHPRDLCGGQRVAPGQGGGNWHCPRRGIRLARPLRSLGLSRPWS